MTEFISPETIWAIFGVVLLLCELFVPGLVIAFFGLGGFITAITTYLGLTPNLAPQLLVFIMSSIFSLVIFRRSLKKLIYKEDDKEEDEKSNSYNVEIGKVVPVIELIEPGVVGGKVRYQGAPWSAECSERVGPGDSVKITGLNNLTLIVEKIE